MNQLIDNLVSALREDIPTLTWMSPETKQAALTKLNAFSRKIGYPDKWRDYSSLNIVPGSYFQDVLASRQFAYHYNISRIGKADDPNEWGGFTPPTVNASYMASRNDITFPAGILQPPFYDPNADDGYNYGGIGVVIGHEMTHGFDDQGAKFDAEGNLRNWWTPEDLKNFNARTNCVCRRGVQRVQCGAGDQHQRQTGDRRRSRGPRRGDARVARVREVAAGQGAADDRRIHSRAALLPRIRPGVGRELRAAGRDARRADRPACAGTLPRERHGAEHAGVRARVPLCRGNQDGARRVETLRDLVRESVGRRRPRRRVIDPLPPNP